MRKYIYETIDAVEDEKTLSKLYDVFMMFIIIASVVPLAFKGDNFVFKWIDYICVSVFVIDYVLRWFTADYKLNRRLSKSFFIYPITPMAIIDLIAILPSISVLSNSFKLLKLFRLIRTLKVMRVFKFLRYSKSFGIVLNVLKKQRRVLGAVATMAVAYILVSALIMFNVEPESFGNYFDAIYWATISLTTVGYGDLYPITVIGRLVTMISSVLGIAIIALPSGVITAGILNEISKDKRTFDE